MGFKAGNIVRKNSGYWGDKNSFDVGELCVVEYSYGERYGNGKCYGGYCILDMETGNSSSWWDEEYLDFVDDGSIDLIYELKEKAEQIKTQQSDIEWIKNNWTGDIFKDFHTTSVLVLFDKIGYDTSFHRNGEYYILINDWFNLHPVFNGIFNGDIDSVTHSVNSVFREEYREQYLKAALEFLNDLKA